MAPFPVFRWAAGIGILTWTATGSAPQPRRPPRRMRPPQPHDPRLHLRQHLMRARLWPRRPVRQPAQPPSFAYRRSHPCTVCRATPYRRATSVTGTPSSRTSSTARYRCSTTPSSTSTPGSLPAISPLIAGKRPGSSKQGTSTECHEPTGTTVAHLPEPPPQPVAQEPKPRCPASTGLAHHPLTTHAPAPDRSEGSPHASPSPADPECQTQM